MFPKTRSVINFSPGPAKIPEAVIERAQRDLHEYENTGVSILELSHRAKEFDDLLHKTQQNLRHIANIPNNYQILFLQGGGTGQFAGIPLNLKALSKGEKQSADYLVTGSWSAKAAKEADKYLHVNKVINPPLKTYTTIPNQSTWNLSHDAAYLYYCANETIEGVEFRKPPDVRSVPLVGDISSNVLSEPVEVSKHGILFAGSQKNLGTSGLTIVIIRDDLIGHADRSCPSVIDYKVMHQANSVFNTPSVFCIYLANLVLEWMKEIGGLEEIQKRNIHKAQLIYDVIDHHKDFYHCPVDTFCRSRMNIPFRIGAKDGNSDLEKLFLKDAEESRNMISLKGYRTVGGVRVSLYNAVTIEEANALAEFMKEFCEKHNK